MNRDQSDHIWDSSGQINSTGSSNAYVIAIAEPVAGYFQGMPPIRFKANFGNTGAATANIVTPNAPSGLGAVTMKKFGGATDLVTGDIVSGGVYTLIHDGTNFQVLELHTGVLVTGNIADDAITYAKIQNVSATSRILGRKTAGAGSIEECTLSEVLDFIGSAVQGDILYRGASAWERLGAGTDGQFLRSGGSAANLSWSGPPLFKLSSIVASNAATVDFTGLSGFAGYLIAVSHLVPQTDNTTLYMRMSTDNGTNYAAGASDYKWAWTLGGSAAATESTDDADSEIQLMDNVGNSTNETVNLAIHLSDLANASNPKAIHYTYFQNDALARAAAGAGGGMYLSSTAVNAVRLLMSSGNINGRFTLYGLPT